MGQLMLFGEGGSDVVTVLSLIDKIGVHQMQVELSNGFE